MNNASSWYSNEPFNSDFVETFKTNAFNASFNAFILDRVIGPFGTCNGSLLVFLGWSTSSPSDTIQARWNSDFDVKCAAIQFYGNNHISQFDRWIGMQFYIFSYLNLKFQGNWSSGRHHNMGQQRLYEFCYLLPFDLWTSYLARILFLQGYGSLFWESPSSTRIFNGL